MRRKLKDIAGELSTKALKQKPRGRHDHAAWKANQFPKGKSGNPGGKPKVFMKFSAMLTAKALQPCPPLIAKQLGLKRGSTIYDAVIAAMLLNAATGDNIAAMNFHDIVEGKLPIKNMNLSVSVEAFLQDAGFRDFLKRHHLEYLHGQGTRTIAGEAIPSLPAAETHDSDGTA